MPSQFTPTRSFRQLENAAHTSSSTEVGGNKSAEIDRYLRLRMQQNLIAQELALLKPVIVTCCERTGGLLKHPLGEISLRSREGWDYPAHLQNLEELLKAMKKTSEEDGTARVKSITIFTATRLAETWKTLISARDKTKQ